jgi:hypothetical protein
MFTSEDGDPRYLRRYVTVVNGEALNTIEVSEKPDFRLLNQAVNVQGRLAELEAIANRGPLADLPSQVHQTIVHRADPVNRRADAACPSNLSESPSSTVSNDSIGPSNAVSNDSIGPSNHHQNGAEGF